LVQGSHLLLPPLLEQYFYLEAPQDQRAVFVLPWKEKLLVGTTETVHEGAPEAAQCLDPERDYLLKTLLYYFPDLDLSQAIVDSFSGLLVLPQGNNQAFSRPREVLLEVNNARHPRVLSLMGGKLTTYRATAEMALRRIEGSLPIRRKRGDTRQLRLTPE